MWWLHFMMHPTFYIHVYIILWPDVDAKPPVLPNVDFFKAKFPQQIATSVLLFFFFLFHFLMEQIPRQNALCSARSSTTQA